MLREVESGALVALGRGVLGGGVDAGVAGAALLLEAGSSPTRSSMGLGSGRGSMGGAATGMKSARDRGSYSVGS